MSRVKTAALQIAMLALHSLAGEYSINLRKHVASNFFNATRTAAVTETIDIHNSTRNVDQENHVPSVSCAMKTWHWIINMVLDYRSARYDKLNRLPDAEYSKECPELTAEGLIDNPNSLIAFPND